MRKICVKDFRLSRKAGSLFFNAGSVLEKGGSLLGKAGCVSAAKLLPLADIYIFQPSLKGGRR